MAGKPSSTKPYGRRVLKIHCNLREYCFFRVVFEISTLPRDLCGRCGKPFSRLPGRLYRIGVRTWKMHCPLLGIASYPLGSFLLPSWAVPCTLLGFLFTLLGIWGLLLSATKDASWRKSFAFLTRGRVTVLTRPSYQGDFSKLPC